MDAVCVNLPDALLFLAGGSVVYVLLNCWREQRQTDGHRFIEYNTHSCSSMPDGT